MGVQKVNSSGAVTNLPSTFIHVTQIVVSGGGYYHTPGWYYMDVYDVNTKSWVNVWSNYCSSYYTSYLNFTVNLSPMRDISAIRFTTTDHYHDLNSVVFDITFNTVELSPITFNNPIHKEDVSVQALVTHLDNKKVQFKILINNVQKYPSSGFTPLSPQPLNINKIFPHTDFNIGNNTLTIVARDEDGYETQRSVTVTKTNQPPILQNPTFSLQTVHSENVVFTATLNDLQGDTVSYRVFLNNVQIHPSTGWSLFEGSPVNIALTIKNDRMIVGANTLRIEFKDDLGATGSWSGTFFKVNAVPTISAQLSGLTLTATINDADGDPVRYRILLNGSQIYPQTGMTDFTPAPVSIKHTLTSSQVNIGSQNLIRIEFEDRLQGSSAWEYRWTAQYAGLMFCDDAEQFYTTDIGALLKYLDMGTIVAGQTSPSVRVWLKNTLGYPVNNIIIWVDQGDLVPGESWVELSASSAPFTPTNELIFPQTLNHNEKIPFYVRVVSTRKAKWGGMFDILTKASPV